MQYNLLENTYLATNSGIGNVVFDSAQIASLKEGTLSEQMYGNGTTLVLDADLGARVKVDEIKYFFSTAIAMETVASGISMYYKDELFDSYSSLYVSLSTSYFYTTISGASAPRYIRLVHALTDSTTSGIINGFSVLNDDTYVNFGEDGLKTSESLHAARNETEISTIPIYNNSGETTDAYASIEPQDTFIDDLLYLSESSSGPWLGLKDTDARVCGSSVWSDGNYDNTTLDANNYLILTANSGIGTYTSKIFKDDGYKYSRLNVSDITPSNTIISNGFEGTKYSIFSSDTLFTSRYVHASSYSYRMEIDKSIYSNITSDSNKIQIEFGCFMSSAPDNGINDSNPLGYTIQSCHIGYAGATDASFESTPTRVTFDNGNSTTIITPVNTFSDPVAFVFNKNKNLVVSFSIYYETAPMGDLQSGITAWYVVNQGYVDSNLTWTSYNVSSFTRNIRNIHIINTDKEEIEDHDNTETIQVRSSKTAPLKHMVYRKFYYMDYKVYNVYENIAATYSRCYYKEYSIPSNVEVYDSYYNEDNSVSDYYNRNFIKYYRQMIDYAPKTGNFAGIIISILGVSGWLWCYLNFFVSNNSTGFNYQDELWLGTQTQDPSVCDADAATIIIHDVKIWSGGVWISFTTEDYSYLRHYDLTATSTYNYYQEEEFAYAMDVDYTTGYLWYSNSVNETITKLDTAGEVLTQYIFGTDDPDPKGVAADGDDGCWFLNGVDLYHINAYGTLIESILDVGDTASLVSYLALDGDDGFWVLEGAVIMYIGRDGRRMNTLHVGYAETFKAIDSGVFITCTDGAQRFVDKSNMSVIMELEEYDHLLPIEYDYTEDGCENKFPLSYDTYWQNLEWREVNPLSYELPEDSFHQTKIVLRGTSDTPEVEGVYINRNIEVSDIPANQSRDIYLKVEIPDEDLNVGAYDSSLRVWLNKPIN
jgi:hypothetical protein